MKKNQRLFTAALLLAANLAAFDGMAEGHRQHDPHVHGVGQLMVALDDNMLSIELESPAINMVGFEHPPGNAEEKERVHAAANLLHEGARLFTPAPAADCRLLKAEVDSELLADEHDHSGEHDHDGEGRHSEFHATYAFHCENPEALTHVDVHLFRHFSAMEALAARFVTDRGQGAAELTPGAFRLTFQAF